MGERKEAEGHVSEGGRETAQPEQDLEAGAAVSVTGSAVVPRIFWR